MQQAKQQDDESSNLTLSQLADLFEAARAKMINTFTSKPHFNASEWYLMKVTWFGSQCEETTLASPSSSSPSSPPPSSPPSTTEPVLVNNSSLKSAPCFSYSPEEGITLAIPSCSCCCSDNSNLVVFTQIHPLSLLVRITMLVLLWWWLWLALPTHLLVLGGPIFDMLTCFVVCFLVGAMLGRICNIPPLLFVFAMGILWGNVPSQRYLTSGISADIRTFVSRTALAVILLRSGLAMSWKTIKPAAVNILTMSFFPLLIEVIVHGFLATALLDYGGSTLWPFLQAMTASPSASAVVGATVLDMRKRGYGISRGPGVLLVPSVILDFTIGIWGINFVAELVFRQEDDTSLARAIGKGPVQMIVGVTVGIAFGFVWYAVFLILLSEARRLPNRRYSTSFLKRVANIGLLVLLLIGLVCVFFGYDENIAGGGCLACTFTAATAQFLLTDEPKRPEQQAEEQLEEFERERIFHAQSVIVKNHMSELLATAWDWIVMPALFAFSGSAIRVDTMFSADFTGKAVACIFTGVAARIVVCTICTWTYDMTVSERIISMIASAGRGSAQVALGGYALTLVQTKLPGGGTEAERRYGTQVYDTATLSVLLMGPVAIVLLTRVGPCFWLKDSEYSQVRPNEPAAAAAAETHEQKSDGAAIPPPSAAAVAN